MAYKIKDIYPSQTTTGDAGWPDGKPRNIQGGVQGTGTPFEEKLFQDYEGSRQALFDEAGIEPSGQADRVGQSDFVDALQGFQKPADSIVMENGDTVQSFVDSFALKIFQSPTDGGLTEIQTRTVSGGEVYEVRKTSDDSLATISSNATGTIEIVQDGTSNVSNNAGTVEFYTANGDYYIVAGGVRSYFVVGVDAGNVSESSGGDLQSIIKDEYGSDEALTRVHRAINKGGTAALMIIGDSITEGVGASNDSNRYANVLDNVINGANKRGYGGYSIDSNLSNLLNDSSRGVTSDGTIQTSGLVNSRLVLADGESVEVDGYEIDYLDLLYEGGAGIADLNFYLNGTLYASKVTNKTVGTMNTFATQLPSRTKKTDTVKIEAVGGSITILGVIPLRKSAGSLVLFRVAKSGWGYQSYNTDAKRKEIRDILNFVAMDKVIILNLGTNNLYNANLQLSPSDLIIEIESFISGLNSLSNMDAKFIVSIPPKADESRWPITNGYTYTDYVRAYVDFSKRNNISLIRHDLVNYTESGLYSDGVHPNDLGHYQMASTITKALRLPFSPVRDDLYYQSPVDNFAEYISPQPLDYNDSWGDFSNSPNFGCRYQKIGNQVFFSGLCQPNSSTDNVLGQLPIGFRPVRGDAYLLCRDSLGVNELTVYQNGNIEVKTTNTWVSLDGVSFIQER